MTVWDLPLDERALKVAEAALGAECEIRSATDAMGDVTVWGAPTYDLPAAIFTYLREAGFEVEEEGPYTDPVVQTRTIREYRLIGPWLTISKQEGE